jgi:hypothetical protein
MTDELSQGDQHQKADPGNGEECEEISKAIHARNNQRVVEGLRFRQAPRPVWWTRPKMDGELPTLPITCRALIVPPKFRPRQ